MDRKRVLWAFVAVATTAALAVYPSLAASAQGQADCGIGDIPNQGGVCPPGNEF